MSEWLPVLAGTTLGLLHQRHHLTTRRLMCLSVGGAVLTTVISGEFIATPMLVVIDGALVAAGIAAIALAHRALLLLRRTHLRHNAAHAANGELLPP